MGVARAATVQSHQGGLSSREGVAELRQVRVQRDTRGVVLVRVHRPMPARGFHGAQGSVRVGRRAAWSTQ